MKNIKKILALVIAMAMIVGTMSLAYAATGDYVVGGEDTITATNVHEGDTVAYYQVVKWVDGTGWTLVAPFNAIDGVTVDVLTAENGITDAIAAKIAAAATGAGTAMTADADDATTFTATVEPGLYYLKATPTTSVDTVYNPAFVSADYSEGGNTVDFSKALSNTSVLKSTTITFEKEVTGDDLFKDTKPGDIIPYQISTQIPSYGDTFTNPTFSITDTFSTGLALKFDDEHPFTVTYGVDGETPSTTSTTNTEVTITGVSDGASTYTVAFKPEYLTGLAGTQPTVTITYYGVVTTEALNNVTYMDNKAVLTYSNTPTTTDSKDDITRHYTFTIDGNLLGGTGSKTDELIKIGVNEDGTPITETKTTHHSEPVSPLNGATFSLTPVSPTTMNDPNPRTATSADGGYLTFVGLDAGTYTLVETEAPTGFIKDTRTFTVTITPHWNTSTPDLLDSYDVVFSDGTNETTASFTMTNTGDTLKTTASTMPDNGIFPRNVRGTELPSTGGVGTTMMYMFGAIFVMFAGVLLVSKRRMAAR
jgi:fimbrial isopeptide formation D2 family protein/LPXTG-motif cell wall-anchored protein